MSVEVYASGTTLADGTEQYLSSPSVAGEFTVEIDRTNMAAGDILYVRVYRTVVSGGSAVLATFDILTGAVATNRPAVWSWGGVNGLVASDALRVSIQQAAGTYRNFPWAVTHVTEQADVTKWNGTAVAAPATAGIPSVDVVSISADTIAADRLESQYDGTGLVGDTYPARQDALAVTDGYAQTASAQATAANAKFGGILSTAGNQLDDWLLAMATDGATAPTALSSAGFDPATDSLEAIRDRGDAAWAAGSGTTAQQVWEYTTRTLTNTDTAISIISPFDASTDRITIGYGEDYTAASSNGVLSLTTTANINLLTAGGTIYFAVRPKSVIVNAAAEFTVTGTATAALAYTVSLASAYTRALNKGTYAWTAWHISAGSLRTALGHGDYVVSDLVQPTTS